MNQVKIWVFSICTAAIVGSIVQILSPSGNMEKVMKVVVGIFFLSCTFVPLATLLPNINYEFEAGSLDQITEINENMQNEITKQTVDYANTQITKAIGDTLEKNKINYKNISVNYNIEQDSSISINEIEITMDEQDKGQATQAISLLEQDTGIKTFVYIEEE